VQSSEPSGCGSPPDGAIANGVTEITPEITPTGLPPEDLGPCCIHVAGSIVVP
jgi:hypothetical protein